jgi:DNA-directed RNA polymerase subunit RPC12/RpoP
MSDEAKSYCQHCGRHIAFEPDLAGQNVICPHCGKETLIDPPQQSISKFFVWQNDQHQGPFDQETVQQMLVDGQIKGETLVCPEDGSLDWTPAKELFLIDSMPENLRPGYVPPALQVGSLEEITINQFHSFVYQTFKADNDVSLEIRLQSGAELKIKAIRLFSESVLRAVAGKRAKAAQGQKGVSTGLGSIGSIEWVVASSLVIGAVEEVLSAGAAKAGTNSLVEALRMEQSLRESVFVFPVSVIQNIEHPKPKLWRVPGESKFRIPHQSPSSHNSAMVHDGDDFVTVETDDGIKRSIRWSSVESYICQK